LGWKSPKIKLNAKIFKGEGFGKFVAGKSQLEFTGHFCRTLLEMFRWFRGDFSELEIFLRIFIVGSNFLVHTGQDLACFGPSTDEQFPIFF
jgi:hypothetical protein